MDALEFDLTWADSDASMDGEGEVRATIPASSLALHEAMRIGDPMQVESSAVVAAVPALNSVGGDSGGRVAVFATPRVRIAMSQGLSSVSIAARHPRHPSRQSRREIGPREASNAGSRSGF